MQKSIVAAASLIAASGYFAEANSTILYDTPGTHLINTTVNENVITAHREADVVVGRRGVIRGEGCDASCTSTAAVRTRLGTLEVTSNGRIVAGVNQNAIDMTGGGSVVRLRDHASVTGDIISALPGLRDEKNSAARLYVQDHAVVNGDVIYGGYVRIQDHALINGDVRGFFNASMNLDMRGGTVGGILQLGGLDDHRVTMSGGSILGGVRGAPSFVEMSMSGGYIGGGLHTVGNLTADLRGGQIDGGISIMQDSMGLSDLSITGGMFDTYDGDWLLAFSDARTHGNPGGFSSLGIAGGQFGYANAGNGLFIDEWVNFNVWGRDLAYNNGWLTGYLQDGSWFRNQLTFGNNWHGTFTIHNVPEPGSWALLIAGLIGIGFARRRPGVISAA